MELKLEDKWMLIVEDLTEEEDIPNLEEFKHLIFDTYQYLESVHSENANYQKDLLLLYKYIIQTSSYLNLMRLERVPLSTAESFIDCLEGLCYVFENGFDYGYLEHSLPLGFQRNIPSGCANPEADMSSYDSFLKTFDNNVEYLKTIGYEDEDR